MQTSSSSPVSPSADSCCCNSATKQCITLYKNVIYIRCIYVMILINMCQVVFNLTFTVNYN